jgi:hypothetical protein
MTVPTNTTHATNTIRVTNATNRHGRAEVPGLDPGISPGHPRLLSLAASAK